MCAHPELNCDAIIVHTYVCISVCTFSLSPTYSLSYTHTHAHIHTRTQTWHSANTDSKPPGASNLAGQEVYQKILKAALNQPASSMIYMLLILVMTAKPA